MKQSVTVLLILIFVQASFVRCLNSVWHYQCTNGYCQKTQITNDSATAQSLAECNLRCLDSAGIWPKPTDSVVVDNLNETSVNLFQADYPQDTQISSLISKGFDVFLANLRKSMPCRAFLKPSTKSSNLNTVIINIQITDQNTTKLSLNTDESYTLEAHGQSGNIINVYITADTYFGARHGLETLSQLVVYDDLNNKTLIPSKILIRDKPVYKWRGLVLDTARNFITPKAIKRTLKAMAASKLNTFHWHITDSQSFPYVSKSHPELSQYGAYSPKKVYSDATIKDILDYATIRGIRVVPEIDAPAHVGEGWQSSGVVTCFGQQPWGSFCAEPPCGQFDPSQSKVYDILEGLYGDMLDQFGTEIFHMGGDEVNINCWNSTERLTKWMTEEKQWSLTTADFINVWKYFQGEATKRLYKKAGQEIPIVLWSSDLTGQEDVAEFLPPEKVFVQVWTTRYDSAIQTLLDKNYSIILSNYDAVYLDCGYSSWISSGNNWCSPYKGWQLIYDNKPKTIAGDRSSQVLGGETPLWTEQAGSGSIDSKLWPRAAAYAEALWTEPETSWAEAENRMLVHRERLVSLGIDADALEPEWCLRNQDKCPLRS